jgi:hypothetical protein
LTAIDWLKELDKEYKITDEHYTIDDFIEEVKISKDELKRRWNFRFGISENGTR